MRTIFWALAIATLTLSSASAEVDNPWGGKLVRPAETKRIQALQFSSLTPPIRAVANTDGNQLICTLEAILTDPAGQLFYKDKPLTPQKKGDTKITFEVPVTGKFTQFTLKKKKSSGREFTEELVVQFDQWSQFNEETRNNPPKRDYFMVSAGVAQTAYEQWGLTPFTMTAIAVKVAYQRLIFPPAWDLAVSAFGTALPLTDNHPTATARFVGLNLRFGYKFESPLSPWSLAVLGGWYYTTMIVTDRKFGFTKMLWPQVFPVLAYRAKNGDRFSFGAKLAPMLNGWTVLPLSNREFGFSLTWLRPLRNGHALSVAGDYSNIVLNYGSTNFATRTLSLNVGYGL